MVFFLINFILLFKVFKLIDFLKSYIKAGQPNLNKRDDRGK